MARPVHNLPPFLSEYIYIYIVFLLLLLLLLLLLMGFQCGKHGPWRKRFVVPYMTGIPGLVSRKYFVLVRQSRVSMWMNRA